MGLRYRVTDVLKLSYKARRALVGIALAACGLCIANYYFHLHFFGRFDEQVMFASLFIYAIILLYVGPSVEEMRKYRDRKRVR